MSHGGLFAAHLLGAAPLGAATVATTFVDRRIRRVHDRDTIGQDRRHAAALAKHVLMPGVVLLAMSRAWPVARYDGGRYFVGIP